MDGGDGEGLAAADLLEAGDQHGAAGVGAVEHRTHRALREEIGGQQLGGDQAWDVGVVEHLHRRAGGNGQLVGAVEDGDLNRIAAQIGDTGVDIAPAAGGAERGIEAIDQRLDRAAGTKAVILHLIDHDEVAIELGQGGVELLRLPGEFGGVVGAARLEGVVRAGGGGGAGVEGGEIIQQVGGDQLEVAIGATGGGGAGLGVDDHRAIGGLEAVLVEIIAEIADEAGKTVADLRRGGGGQRIAQEGDGVGVLHVQPVIDQDRARAELVQIGVIACHAGGIGLGELGGLATLCHAHLAIAVEVVHFGDGHALRQADEHALIGFQIGQHAPARGDGAIGGQVHVDREIADHLRRGIGTGGEDIDAGGGVADHQLGLVISLGHHAGHPHDVADIHVGAGGGGAIGLVDEDAIRGQRIAIARDHLDEEALQVAGGIAIAVLVVAGDHALDGDGVANKRRGGAAALDGADGGGGVVVIEHGAGGRGGAQRIAGGRIAERHGKALIGLDGGVASDIDHQRGGGGGAGQGGGEGRAQGEARDGDAAQGDGGDVGLVEALAAVDGDAHCGIARRYGTARNAVGVGGAAAIALGQRDGGGREADGGCAAATAAAGG